MFYFLEMETGGAADLPLWEPREAGVGVGFGTLQGY
jgi:hypothetical protein